MGSEKGEGKCLQTSEKSSPSLETRGLMARQKAGHPPPYIASPAADIRNPYRVEQTRTRRADTFDGSQTGPQFQPSLTPTRGSLRGS